MRDLFKPHLLTMNNALPPVLVGQESAFAIGFLIPGPVPRSTVPGDILGVTGSVMMGASPIWYFLACGVVTCVVAEG